MMRPVVATTRTITLGVIAASAVGRLVILAFPPPPAHQETDNWTQWIVICLVTGLWLIVTVLLSTREREAEFRRTAIPMADFEQVWRTYREQDAVSRVRGVLKPLAVALGVAVVGGYLVHMPWLLLALPLQRAVMFADSLSLARWEKEHGVVVWRPARQSGDPLAGVLRYYTTPPSPV